MHFEHLLNPNYVGVALYIYKYELSCFFNGEEECYPTRPSKISIGMRSSDC